LALSAPVSVLASEYVRTPDGASPENPIHFQATQIFEEDIVGCGNPRFQLVIFEGENSNYGAPGYYFPIRSTADEFGFAVDETASLDVGTYYGLIALFTFSPGDTIEPTCDINILEYSGFTPAAPAVFQNMTISGNAWHDIDNNGSWEPTEAMLAGWTIFIDLNNNGFWDLGETSTITDETGYYSLADIGPGDHRICAMMQSGWAPTYPANPPCHIVTVVNGVDTPNKNFGVLGNHAGAIGFWKNWARHKTYSENEVNGWLAEIGEESEWPMEGFEKSCSGISQLECAKKKFLAEYLAAQLNEKSGRKHLETYYLIDGALLMLGDIFAATESASPSTKEEFLALASIFNYINSIGI